MPSVLHWTHRVTLADIDGLRHVSNIVYIQWMQSAAVAHSAAQGWPGDAYERLGAGWVVRSHFIEYLAPAFADDEILIHTWVANLKRVTSLRRFRFFKRGAGPDGQDLLLAQAATDWAFVDYTTGKLKRIPPEVASAFEVVPDNAPPAQPQNGD